MSESVDMLRILGDAEPGSLIHEVIAELYRRKALNWESVQRDGDRLRVVLDVRLK